MREKQFNHHHIYIYIYNELGTFYTDSKITRDGLLGRSPARSKFTHYMHIFPLATA